MKKVFKRAIPFVLVVVLCVCMTVPAFADTGVATTMRSFPSLGYGCSYSLYNAYTTLVQRAMYLHSYSTRDYITGSGGVDGSYGSGTVDAVLAYQSASGLYSDGITGPDTWASIGSKLRYGSLDNSTGQQIRLGTFVGTNYSGLAMRFFYMPTSGMVSSNTIWHAYDGEYYVYLQTGLEPEVD